MLFTLPGERVNRPDFGSGLLQLVFAPLSRRARRRDPVARPGRARSSGSATSIAVERVEVTRADATLAVIVEYVVQRTGERRTDRFEQPGAAP